MLSTKAQAALNKANRLAGEEGYLVAGFIMLGDELVSIFDNVPGSMSVGAFRNLLHAVRESLKSGNDVKVEQEDLVGDVPPEEIN